MLSKVFVFLAFLFSSVVAQLTTLADDPICVKIEPITIAGATQAVDVDGSTSQAQSTVTTGDMSIAVSLKPDTLPQSTGYFIVYEFDTKAICVATTNQVPGSFSAPTCLLETYLKICSKDNIQLRGRDLQRQVVDPVRGIEHDGAPGLGCTSPVYEGYITAHGSGPDPFAITGGTGDFFGAFGLIDGAGTFVPIPGGVKFDAAVNVCFFPDAI